MQSAHGLRIQDVLAELNRTLVQAGVAVHRLEPIESSLEQRFLEITSRLGQSGEAAA